MSEEQLRDVLARVVPDPPDTVADPAPVVRAARVRGRMQVAVVAGVVAAVAVGGVMGGRALLDDGSAPPVAGEPSISADPYGALPCPDVDELPVNGPLPERIVAVRFCAVPFNGVPASPGPSDALVEDLDSFRDAVAALPVADPSRCAAVDVLPTDSRLLFQLAGGSPATVPTGFCQDVTVAGRSVDAADVTQAFLAALDQQRDDFPYAAGSRPPLDCQSPATTGPAEPARDSLVEAVMCPAGPHRGEPLDQDGLALLRDGWQQARPEREPCSGGVPTPDIVAGTDRGDVVRLSGQCDHLQFSSWHLGVTYELPVNVDDLNAS
jgi:hypothetical protein